MLLDPARIILDQNFRLDKQARIIVEVARREMHDLVLGTDLRVAGILNKKRV